MPTCDLSPSPWATFRDLSSENERKERQDRSSTGRLKYELQKAWLKTSRSFLGRRSLDWMQPGAVCYFDAARYPSLQGQVALTIDDAPCSRDDACFSMMPEMRQLLAEFGVKATFFCRTDYAPNHVEEMEALMQEGHEVCLQCPSSWFETSTSPESFEKALVQNQALLETLRTGLAQTQTQAMAQAVAQDGRAGLAKQEEAGASPTEATPQTGGDSSRSTSTTTSTCSTTSTNASFKQRYLRASSTKLTKSKSKLAILEKHDYLNIGADCNTVESITDPELLAHHMLEQAASGSIVAFRMPERGYREETYLALRCFLQGLARQGLRACSVASMMAIVQKVHQDEHREQRRLEAKAEADVTMDVEAFLSEPANQRSSAVESNSEQSPAQTDAVTTPAPKWRQRQRPRLNSAPTSAVDTSSRSRSTATTTLAIRQPWSWSWPWTTRASPSSSPRSAPGSPSRSPMRSPTSAKLAECKVEFHKLCWRAVQSLGSRKALNGIFPGSLCYLDEARYPGVQGMVALTIDDAPCSRSDPCFSMVPEVKELLALYGAQATFFLCTDYVQGHEEGMQELMAAGHEVANHCPADRSYANDPIESFEEALLSAEAVCDRLRSQFQERQSSCNGSVPAGAADAAAGAGAGAATARRHAEGGAATASREEEAVALETEVPEIPPIFATTPNLLPPLRHGERPPPRWFRAPHGRMTPAMKEVLDRHNFQNVLTDCYANDPWISDANFIAASMLQKVESGSVAVIHMPEHGFRGYNFRALTLFLEGLKVRNLKAVSLTTLHRAAERRDASPL